MKLPFNDETSQHERRAVLESERDASTFHQFAHDDDGGGRFKNQTPRHVVGSTPSPQYPAGPNWSADPTGVEPPLGVSINEMTPAGESFEIEKSLAEVRDNAVPPSAPLPVSPSGDEQRSMGPQPPPDAARSPLLKRRGRKP
jgi:hypothetical protein